MNECYINIFEACILFINTVCILHEIKLKNVSYYGIWLEKDKAENPTIITLSHSQMLRTVATKYFHYFSA